MTTRDPAPASRQSPPRPLRIGDLAARSGHSAHAIRWYESIGLMPGVRRDGANRRVYDERHVQWLAFMDRLRTTGMSTARMTEYARLVGRGTTSLPLQRELLARHRDEVRGRLDEWRRALALLDRKLAFCDDWLRTGSRPGRPAGAEQPCPARRPPSLPKQKTP
jgi:DNA-binding transcriptional MerR regulator